MHITGREDEKTIIIPMNGAAAETKKHVKSSHFSCFSILAYFLSFSALLREKKVQKETAPT